MKRIFIALVLLALMLLPLAAIDTDPSPWRGTFYPKFGATFYPGAVGISVGLQGLLDFDHIKKPLNAYLGTRAFICATTTSTYTDTDIYGTIGGGLRISPFKDPATGRSPVALRLGMDVGGGYTNRQPTVGAATVYPAWFWEPNAKLEFSLAALGISISGGYRSIISPKNGWSFKKDAGYVSLGLFAVQ